MRQAGQDPGGRPGKARPQAPGEARPQAPGEDRRQAAGEDRPQAAGEGRVQPAVQAPPRHGGPLAAVEGVRRFFPPDVEALRGVDLAIGPGEWVAVMGPSGCGKTTLLNLLGLLDRPTQGRVWLLGLDVGELEERERDALRARAISFVFQAFHLVPHLTAVENVELGLACAGEGLRARRPLAISALREVGMEHRLAARPATLSGGEQQRVAIARALVRRPALLLCDEPTGNLDSANGRAVLDLLHRAREAGHGVVVATHDPEVARRADRVVRMLDGRILTSRQRRTTTRPAAAGGGKPDGVGGGKANGSAEGTPAGVPPRAVAGGLRGALVGPLAAPPHAVQLADLLRDSWRAASRRRFRAALTVAAIALGVGTLVATAGLAASGSVQVTRRFDVFAATAVRVPLPSTREASEAAAAAARLRRLPGVRKAGLFVREGGKTLQARSLWAPRPIPAPLIVADGAGLAAAQPLVLAGRLPESWQLERDRRLAVLGLGLARELRVWPDPGHDAFELGGQPFFAAAVVEDRGDEAVLIPSVVLGPGGAALFGAPRSWELLVRTEEGVGEQVAGWAPLAALPEDPERVVAVVAPEPRRLRGAIGSDLQVLLAVLAAMTTLLGALGISSVLAVAVWERRAEIGLRRALGATRRAVGGLFLAEGLAYGGLGGLVGTVVGLLGAAAVVEIKGWEFALPAFPLAAPAGGAVVGLVAGTASALRAARLDPAEALRS